MQLKLRNYMVSFIMVCDVRNMFKYAFEISQFFHTLYTEERNAV